MQRDPTKRFSDRVAYYIKYRPQYPAQILEVLTTDCGLTLTSVIADIGSGTGFLAERFLENGNTVFGVEPNDEMRQAGENLLAHYDNFISINGSAEATTLTSSSFDFVTAGQAFHWFDVERCKKEFARILKSTGWAVLIWNDRKTNATEFLKAYEELLVKCSTDYQQVDHKKVDAGILTQFFGDKDFSVRIHDNYQILDYEGLEGRLLSSSYVPAKGHPKYPAMLAELKQLFANFQKDGKVILEYETKMYFGQLKV